MERWHAKVIAGVVMLIAILICFLLPVKLTGFFLRKGNRGQYYLDLLACFAGGVFLAAYLIFMAPSVRELLLVNLMRPYSIEYPLPDMLIGIGFFVLLLLNRTVILFSKMSKRLLKKDRHTNGDSIVEKSFMSSEVGTYQPSGNMSQVATENSNGIVLTISRSDTTTNILDNDTSVVPVEAEDCFEHNCHTISPYPLPRRSSITDVAHQDSTVRSIVMMLALSLDSVLEGVTTGLKTTVLEVWAIFIGNLVHETVIAFCLGLQLTRVHKDDYKPVIIAAVAYALMNPIGLALATAIFESVDSNPCIDLANGLFQALTSGCFIYVTFCEILEGQITHKTSFMKIGAMFAGYSVLAAFAAVPGSSPYSFSEPEASQNSTCFSYRT